MSNQNFKYSIKRVFHCQTMTSTNKSGLALSKLLYNMRFPYTVNYFQEAVWIPTKVSVKLIVLHHLEARFGKASPWACAIKPFKTASALA